MVALALVALPAAVPAQSIKLEVVSSRPELVTGRTALVRVTGTDERPPAYASNDTLITGWRRPAPVRGTLLTYAADSSVRVSALP